MRGIERVVVVLWMGCAGGGPEVSAEVELPGPPRGAMEVAAPAPPGSTVSLPITLGLPAIRAQVLAKVPQVLVDSQGEQLEKGLVADVKVERSGEPTVSSGGGAITIDVPLTTTVRPRPGFAKGAKGAVGQVDAALVVTVALSPELSTDWQLVPHARVTYRWVDEPVLTAGPFKVNLRDKADAKLSARFAEVAASLDADLSKELDVQAKVTEAWGQLDQPRRVAEDPPTWLGFSPEALYASQPWAGPEGLTLRVGAAGVLEVVVGEAPPSTTGRSLPPRTAPPADTGARVAVPLTVAWDALTRALAERLEGQRFERALPAGGTADVAVARVIDVYPTGTSVAVGVELTGQVAGVETTVRLWLQGRPALKDDALHVVDFSYVARSDSRWFQLAHDQLAGPIRDAIAERLVLPLSEPRAAAIAQVNEALAGDPPADGIRLRGALERADLIDVRVTEAGLVVHAALAGELSVTVVK